MFGSEKKKVKRNMGVVFKQLKLCHFRKDLVPFVSSQWIEFICGIYRETDFSSI
jgi:hypothetical protein